jgi:hypothetical protein
VLCQVPFFPSLFEVEVVVKFGLTAFLIGIVCLPVFGESRSADPETWYVENYAALWEEKPGDNLDAMLTHYAASVVEHSADGTVTTTPAHEWLAQPMQEWLADGWLKASLVTVQTDRINATTASFKARWLDLYVDAQEEMSCGWYLADLRNGRWSFTAYADLVCADHGL